MISIIMPAYNEEKTIRDAIEDIEQQTMQDYQLIIINDGSTDNTAAIIEEKAATNNKIHFLNPGKVGKVAAYNQASKLVTGDWVYFMGADDRLPHEAFERWLSVANDYNPEEKIALRGRMHVISENPMYDGLILPKNNAVRNFSGPLTLMSRAMHAFILPIPEQYPNEDSWWTLCIEYFAEKTVMVDEIIVDYRIHEGNSISRNSTFESFNEKYHIRYIVREDFLKRFDSLLTASDKAQIQQELDWESARYTGQKGRILFAKGMSYVQRARFFMLSGPKVYAIKKKFDRFFLGH